MIRGMKEAAEALVGHATPGKFPGAFRVVLLVLCLLPSSVVACTDMLPVPLLEDPIVAVRSQSASLRAGPGPSYAVVAQLPQGTILEVQGRNQAGEWIHVIHRGQALWIYTDYTDLTPDRLADLLLVPILVSVLEPTLEPLRTKFVTLTVTAATVNVRTGPSTDFPVRTQVQQGDRLQGQGLNADGNWVQVSDPTAGHGIPMDLCSAYEPGGASSSRSARSGRAPAARHPGAGIHLHSAAGPRAPLLLGMVR